MVDQDEFTPAEIERQDYVDNAINTLILSCAPQDLQVPWNIELIGEVRDILKEIIVDKLHLMTEQQFYPYKVEYTKKN